jgi:hypothetical protein
VPGQARSAIAASHERRRLLSIVLRSFHVVLPSIPSLIFCFFAVLRIRQDLSPRLKLGFGPVSSAFARLTDDDDHGVPRALVVMYIIHAILVV